MPNVKTIQDVDIPHAIGEWMRSKGGKIASINYVGNAPQGQRILSDYMIRWGNTSEPTEQDLIDIWNEKIQPVIDNPPPEPELIDPPLVSDDPLVNELLQRVQRLEAQIKKLLKA